MHFFRQTVLTVCYCFSAEHIIYFLRITGENVVVFRLYYTVFQSVFQHQVWQNVLYIQIVELFPEMVPFTGVLLPESFRFCARQRSDPGGPTAENGRLIDRITRFSPDDLCYNHNLSAKASGDTGNMWTFCTKFLPSVVGAYSLLLY